jgi:hypothetical protein
MEDGEEQTEGVFYGAIATKSYARTLGRPYLELCTRPISRPIVYPDTSRFTAISTLSWNSITIVLCVDVKWCWQPLDQNVALAE